jgi:CRP-like cAMP-binding protein
MHQGVFCAFLWLCLYGFSFHLPPALSALQRGLNGGMTYTCERQCRAWNAFAGKESVMNQSSSPRSDSTDTSNETPGNAILAALPAGEYQRLASHLTMVELEKGQVLHQEGEPPQSVYFLTEGLAILSISGAEGNSLEMSAVGNESILGERAVFEGGLPLIRCSMLTAGRAYKLPPTVLHDEFNEGGKLHDLVMRVIEARIVETSQNALCNQTHSIEQRLSRWLLLMADRLHSHTLSLTHEEVGELLGVRRSSITVAAGHLRKPG